MRSAFGARKATQSGSAGGRRSRTGRRRSRGPSSRRRRRRGTPTWRGRAGLQRAEAPRKIAKKSRSGRPSWNAPPWHGKRTRARRTPRAVPRRCARRPPPDGDRVDERDHAAATITTTTRSPRNQNARSVTAASFAKFASTSSQPRPARTRAAPWRGRSGEAARVRERQGQQHEQEHRGVQQQGRRRRRRPRWGSSAGNRRRGSRRGARPGPPRPRRAWAGPVRWELGPPGRRS